jgi:Protein of unknown function (DUF3455)
MRAATVSLIALALSVAPLCGQSTGGSIAVPAGAKLLLAMRGEGVQVYACSPTQSGFQWALKGPDARLFDSSGKQVGTHFAGPTWRLDDGGSVQGELMASQAAPEPGAVAWLLLRARSGTAAGSLASVAYIRRTKTSGGVADNSACRSADDVGKMVRVAYSATYSFYSAR